MSSPQRIRLRVKNVYKSEVVHVDVALADTIAAMKRLVSAQCSGNPPATTLTLVFGGKICGDAKTVHEVVQRADLTDTLTFNLLIRKPSAATPSPAASAPAAPDLSRTVSTPVPPSNGGIPRLRRSISAVPPARPPRQPPTPPRHAAAARTTGIAEAPAVAVAAPVTRAQSMPAQSTLPPRPAAASSGGSAVLGTLLSSPAPSPQLAASPAVPVVTASPGASLPPAAVYTSPLLSAYGMGVPPPLLASMSSTSSAPYTSPMTSPLLSPMMSPMVSPMMTPAMSPMLHHSPLLSALATPPPPPPVSVAASPQHAEALARVHAAYGNLVRQQSMAAAQLHATPPLHPVLQTAHSAPAGAGQWAQSSHPAVMSSDVQRWFAAQTQAAHAQLGTTPQPAAAVAAPIPPTAGAGDATAPADAADAGEQDGAAEAVDAGNGGADAAAGEDAEPAPPGLLRRLFNWQLIFKMMALMFLVGPPTGSVRFYYMLAACAVLYLYTVGVFSWCTCRRAQGTAPVRYPHNTRGVVADVVVATTSMFTSILPFWTPPPRLPTLEDEIAEARAALEAETAAAAGDNGAGQGEGAGEGAGAGAEVAAAAQ